MILDDDALKAGVDLIGRTGATAFQVGYLHDDVPIEEAGWYAYAQYKGIRITAEDHRGPVEAVEALARRLLAGATCVSCGGVITLSDKSALVYYPAVLIDGTEVDEETARTMKPCRWTRVGMSWRKGCELGK